MNPISFISNFVSSLSNKKVIHLEGNSVRVNIGVRLDDSIGMTDYSRYYKVKKGKVRRKFVYDHKSINNNFKTYDLIPITNSAYIVIIEKRPKYGRRNPLFTDKKEEIMIWKVKLDKNSSKKLIVKRSFDKEFGN